MRSSCMYGRFHLPGKSVEAQVRRESETRNVGIWKRLRTRRSCEHRHVGALDMIVQMTVMAR